MDDNFGNTRDKGFTLHLTEKEVYLLADALGAQWVNLNTSKRRRELPSVQARIKENRALHERLTELVTFRCPICQLRTFAPNGHITCLNNAALEKK